MDYVTTFQDIYLEYHLNIDTLLKSAGQLAKNHQMPSLILLPYNLAVPNQIKGFIFGLIVSAISFQSAREVKRDVT
jgi:hypothetical protein